MATIKPYGWGIRSDLRCYYVNSRKNYLVLHKALYEDSNIGK